MTRENLEDAAKKNPAMDKQNSDSVKHFRNVEVWLNKFNKRDRTYRGMERLRNKKTVVIRISRHSKGNQKAEAREGTQTDSEMTSGARDRRGR
jgi:hypothetical protein